MKAALVLLLALTADAADPLRVYRSRARGYSFSYPPTFVLKAGKDTVSVFADRQDADPCFWIEIKPLEGLVVHVKALGDYLYDPKANEWHLQNGYDEESVSRLRVTYLTKAKIPAYVSSNTMANAYRDETIITDKGYALVVHYQDSATSDARQVNQMIGESLKLTVKPVEASIAEPEPAALR